MLGEMGEELRSRTQAEHLYTAAAIGSFGATVWGVGGGLNNKLADPVWSDPAFASAVGIMIVAIGVCLKIRNAHVGYEYVWKSRAELVDRLRADYKFVNRTIPVAIRKRRAGPGYLYSIIVVAAAALGSTFFCWSILSKMHLCFYVFAVDFGIALIASSLLFFLADAAIKRLEKRVNKRLEEADLCK